MKLLHNALTLIEQLLIVDYIILGRYIVSNNNI